MTMIQEGLVGVFDILGYQNIIDNNEIEDVSKIVLEILTKLPSAAKDTLTRLISDEESRNFFIKEKENLKSLIISDTILLSLSVDPKALHGNKMSNWAIFLLHAAMLLRLAFDKGLPLRGSIDSGNFFILDNCFAGKPIVNAYRLANQLQFSGCALTPKVEKEFKNDLNRSQDAIRCLFFPYLLPLKNNEEMKLSLVNWLNPFDSWKEVPDDICQYVVKAFHAHNKDVSQKDIQKLINTEIIMRYSISKSWIV
ncbi:hypothetical protein [uncultured Candidatus Kuenenia sp.]|jgi:hypothetical protein|uniref:hypothetical protein n=1 Tax=uncultured Candidatus Kuenenia sp. TaxID=1048336 RepID=UPI0002D4BBC4|nr:hypothetical protein [uncultured Candidatus Kuenenia sp.]